MNNRCAEKLIFSLIPKMEAISPEAISCGHHRRAGRVIKRTNVESDLIWSPLTPGPYLVPLTRWIE